MSEQVKTVRYPSRGISILGLLGAAFVVFKLTHVIDWSWFWVTAPFWGGLGVFAVLFLLFCLFMLGAGLIAWVGSRGRSRW